MTLSRRFRCLVPLLTVALVAIAVSACTPVKDTSGSCTQFWRGYVLASDHNYAGLGAFSGSDRYMCKDTPTQGVRAQLQHLRNYADGAVTPDQLGHPFEPRVKYDAAAFMSFQFKGAAPRWVDLNGKWAVPGTTYAQTIVGICNSIRASENPGATAFAATDGIKGASRLTAAQIGNYVAKTGNTWRPEISPTQMAQLYLDEGAVAQVRGDIAFCQSILETGWFSWPGSYAGAEVSATDATNAPFFELRDRTTARN
jgi:hypothetical protein